jgi:hypothetical protein
MKICEKNKGKTKNGNLNRSLGRSNPSAQPNTRGLLLLPPMRMTTDRWASRSERGQGIKRRRAPASSPGNLSLPSRSPSSFALVQVGETAKVVAEKARHQPWWTAVIAPARCGNLLEPVRIQEGRWCSQTMSTPARRRSEHGSGEAILAKRWWLR